MSRKELREELQRFATECDKLSKALTQDECVMSKKELKATKKSSARILESYRDWANNLLPKI